MKTLLSALLTLAVISTVSGQTKKIVDNNIYKIKSISFSYSRGIKVGINRTKKIELVKDSAYLKILKLDTFAIPFLIPYLADTTDTGIFNPCHQTKLKIADIAFLLINDIEFVPYGRVVHAQMCTWVPCDSLPPTYIQYYENQRNDMSSFKALFENYFYSSNRKDIVEWVHRRRDNE